MTKDAVAFRKWLVRNDACLAGRQFAAGRGPLQVLCDPELPEPYFRWYVEHVRAVSTISWELPSVPRLELFRETVSYHNMSPFMRWAFVRELLLSNFVTVDPRHMLFVQTACGGVVPVPRTCFVGRRFWYSVALTLVNGKFAYATRS